MSMTEEWPEKAVEIERLDKKYANFQALKGIDLTVQRGEVHAIVGQNGAGKSTLLGILSGRISPSAGSVRILGRSLVFGDPRMSRKAGISTIYQELTIAPNLTAAANVFLGQTISCGGLLSEQKMRARFMELCDMMGVRLNPRTQARRLSVADQQVLEIMRGIQSDAQILILDEPTASLAISERQALFRFIRSLRERGITIIYVSHYLDEVLDISDSITVFRNGEKVRTAVASDWNHTSLVETMLGSEAIGFQRHSARTRKEIGPEILRAEGVTVPGAIQDVRLTVRSGEIVGIGGLAGSGRTTLFRALAGLEKRSSGRLWIYGKEVPWPRNPLQAIRYGIVLAPEDRKTQGLVLGLSASENINMINYKKTHKNFLFDQKLAYGIANDLGRKFGLTRPVMTPARHLSGGNQQKVLLSKVCNAGPKVLLVDEPTRGIDIGAKVEVKAMLEQLSGEGMGVVVISSELEEVVELSDRTIVLSQGRLVKELTGEEEMTEFHILNAAFNGGKS